jgi:hypothetical protein
MVAGKAKEQGASQRLEERTGWAIVHKQDQRRRGLQRCARARGVAVECFTTGRCQHMVESSAKRSSVVEQWPKKPSPQRSDN